MDHARFLRLLRTSELQPWPTSGSDRVSDTHLRAFGEAGATLLAVAGRLPGRASFSLRTRTDNPNLECVCTWPDAARAADAGFSFFEHEEAMAWAAGGPTRPRTHWRGDWNVGFAPLASLPPRHRERWSESAAPVSAGGLVPVAFAVGGAYRDEKPDLRSPDDGELKLFAGVLTALAGGLTGGAGQAPGPLDPGGPGVDLLYGALGKRATRFVLHRLDPSPPVDAAPDLFLRADLLDAEPPIWRRLRVPAAATLADLHGALQVVFGFEDEHPHCFEALGPRNRVLHRHAPADWHDHGEGGAPTEEVTLLEAFPRVGVAMGYWYDFGDDWRVRLERVEPTPGDADKAGAGGTGFACLAGERAGPPEDVGGVWGYARLLQQREALLAASPRPGKDEDEEAAWLRSLRPDAFHLPTINRRLRGGRRPRPGGWS